MKLIGVPAQACPLLDILGVTVMFEVMTLVVVLVALKDGKAPDPLAKIPVAVLSFTQL